MAVVIIRVEPKNLLKTQMQILHDFRKRVPSYIDFSKSYLNKALIKNFSNDYLKKLIENFEKNKQRKFRKDGRVSLVGLIAFPGDICDNMIFSQINAFDKAAIKVVGKISEILDVELRYIVRHCDESKIHYHFLLDYITKDFSKTIKNKLTKKFFSQLQDLAVAEFSSLGLKRGTRISEKLKNYSPEKIKKLNLKHKKVRELHAIAERKLIDAIKKARREIEILKIITTIIQQGKLIKLKSLKDKKIDEKILRLALEYNKKRLLLNEIENSIQQILKDRHLYEDKNTIIRKIKKYIDFLQNLKKEIEENKQNNKSLVLSAG